MVDLEQAMQGRGAYLCFRNECVENAKKRHSLQRALKHPLSADIWIDVERAIADCPQHENYSCGPIEQARTAGDLPERELPEDKQEE